MAIGRVDVAADDDRALARAAATIVVVIVVDVVVVDIAAVVVSATVVSPNLSVAATPVLSPYIHIQHINQSYNLIETSTVEYMKYDVKHSSNRMH